MLKIENVVLPSPEQWEIVIEGMRNPMNSWHLSDSAICQGADGFEDCTISITGVCPRHENFQNDVFCLGANDHKLMMGLAKGGAVHAKYRRMIPVFLTIDAPLYWWKEFDAYKIGTVANSCSTMHKIHAKKFTMDDFSHEHLAKFEKGVLQYIIDALNWARDKFLETKEKKWWWHMIQLLPSSYNQKRTVMVNYEVLAKMHVERRHHKLDEWHTFCDWIEQLPHADIMLVED